MQILISTILSVGIALISVIGAYNYLPLEIIKPLGEQMLGTSITTINGSDTMSSSRTVINDNFSALNIGKIETSATTLPNVITMAGLTTAINLSTVGTIGLGIWNGTAIGVGYGGTGTTSPTSNHVLLGDGSSGLKVVAGKGTTGQLLTSNGTGSAPTWQTPTAIPAGSITAYATTTPPTGWFLCDGSSKDTTTYADLFAIIGYSYGGTGANFTLPNLRGRQILMASTTANMMQTGGESNHTMTEAELVAHTHGIPTFNGPTGTQNKVNFAGDNTSVGTATSNSTGSTNPFNVLDPYMALNYIIKY